MLFSACLSTVSTLTNRHQWFGTLKKVGAGSGDGGSIFYFPQDSRLMRQNQLKPRFKKRKILKSADIMGMYVGCRECGSCCEDSLWQLFLLTSTLHSVPNATGICCLWPSLVVPGKLGYHLCSLWISCAGRMRPDNPGGKALNGKGFKKC